MGRADRVIAFIENLTITSGTHSGTPFVLREWQREIIHRIYDPAYEDGRRKVRTALITMPRKNGKTQLAAGLCLAHLLGPEAEDRGQIYSAAADRNQASLIYQECVAMIRADVDLVGMVNIIETTKRIVHYPTGSFYQALSADHRSKHGFNASVIVYDELAQAPNRKMYDVLTTSTAARSEPLTVVISTQSGDPNHVLSELIDYGQKVASGLIDDDSFSATLFAAPADADPWDEAVWHACNPALGDFRSLEEMRQYAAQAKRIPSREATFRSLYLNQPTGDQERFINEAEWMACAAPVDPDELIGARCYGGLDLSSTRDLTALVLYFPDHGGAVLPYFWLPGDELDAREDHDRVPYQKWRDQGFLETTAGRAVDRRAIGLRLAEIEATYDVQAIAYDRWRIEDLRVLLTEEGVDLPLEPFGQGFKDMGPATDHLETAIINGDIAHGGHPILTWNASNAGILIDPSGAKKLAKNKSIGRIDGVVALAMALGIAHRSAPKDRSVYETRGIIYV